MAKADAEEGHLAQELLDLRDLIDVFRRVAGAVGEHDAVGMGLQHLLRGDGGRQHRHGAAPLLQLPGDVALGAVVDEAHPQALLPLRRVHRGLGAGDRLHHTGDGVGLYRRQIRRHLVADGGVHDAVLPDDPGQLPGIDAPEARDSLLFQIGIQVAVAAEVGGRVAPLPDHIPLDAARALKILPDDPVVADEGIGLQHDLSGVAGVCQRLDVAAHAGGEHQLTHGVPFRAETDALEHLAVLKHQISFFHDLLPPVVLSGHSPTNLHAFSIYYDGFSQNSQFPPPDSAQSFP